MQPLIIRARQVSLRARQTYAKVDKALQGREMESARRLTDYGK